MEVSLVNQLFIIGCMILYRRNGHHLWQVLRYIRRIFQKIETTNAINIDAAHL